jgi:hypothetical protein
MKHEASKTIKNYPHNPSNRPWRPKWLGNYKDPTLFR